jgi:cysteine desulfurase
MADKRIYLDYAASTPVDERVMAAMRPYFSEIFANPGSIHEFGRRAQSALDMSRQKIAKIFGADFSGIVFTASATEANNLIIQGVVKRYWRDGGQDRRLPHLITSTIEHESVLNVCRDLEARGLLEVTYLPVNSQGFVEPQTIIQALRSQTVLVSIMYVSNVTGAIQPLEQIGRVIAKFKKDKLLPQNQSLYTPKELLYPIFHTDAAQAVHSLAKITLAELGVEAMTISGHKMYGPKGSAALVSNFPLNLAIDPMMIGGWQEFGLRASTQDLPDIIGLVSALELVRKELAQEQTHTQELKKILISGITKIYPRAVINSFEPNVFGVCNISFPGFSLEDLLYRFDKQGISAAAGSACSAKALKPSHVLLAMGLSEALLNSAIRFSFGKGVSLEDMKYCVSQLPKILS